MRKIIQNYSILVFPLLAGLITLFAVRELKFNQDKSYAAIWIVIGIILIIAPMLKLSMGKTRFVRLILGFIAIIMFYIFSGIFTGITGSGFHTHGSSIEWLLMLFVYMYFHVVDFFCFNITVLIVFVFNNIYAEKVGKMLRIEERQ